MGFSVPLGKKETLIPQQVIHRDPHQINHGDRLSPIYILIMMPNTIGMFARAYRRNDYSLASLGLSVFLIFVLLEYCLSNYHAIPKHEKSNRKFWLKLMMWFLYTVFAFTFAYQVTCLFDLHIAVGLYAVVMVFSALLFYALIIRDHVKNWRIRIHGEEEIGIVGNQTVDSGKSNYSGSVLEKV